MISKNKIIFLPAFVFASSMLISCDRKETSLLQEESKREENGNVVGFSTAQYQTAGIELGSVQNKQISGTIKVNGLLDVPPQQQVSISVPLGGFLKETPLLQGTKVAKGQVIAIVENLDFIQIQQDYLETKNQLEFAQADYNRQQELAKDNVNSQKTLQQSKATYSGLTGKMAGLREKLKVLRVDLAALEAGSVKSSISLVSPINGYVTEVNVNIGKFVNPSDILFEIVDTEHLHAELTVFEKDIPKVKIGQKVRFTLANETKERMATVYLLGRKISADRTIRIHCHIDTEDTNLLPGMYLKAVVETAGAELPALPDEAIIDFQGRKYIFYQVASQRQQTAEDPGGNEPAFHFEMLEVQAGNSELGFTEVILPPEFPTDSARVVVKNAYSILSKIMNSDDSGGD